MVVDKSSHFFSSLGSIVVDRSSHFFSSFGSIVVDSCELVSVVSNVSSSNFFISCLNIFVSSEVVDVSVRPPLYISWFRTAVQTGCDFLVDFFSVLTLLSVDFFRLLLPTFWLVVLTVLSEFIGDNAQLKTVLVGLLDVRAGVDVANNPSFIIEYGTVTTGTLPTCIGKFVRVPRKKPVSSCTSTTGHIIGATLLDIHTKSCLKTKISILNMCANINKVVSNPQVMH